MNLRQIALVGLAALALGGTALAQAGPSSQSGPATPPPPPAPNGNVATPRNADRHAGTGRRRRSARPAGRRRPARPRPAAPARPARLRPTPEPGPRETPRAASVLDDGRRVGSPAPAAGRHRPDGVLALVRHAKKPRRSRGTWPASDKEKLAFSRDLRRPALQADRDRRREDHLHAERLRRELLATWSAWSPRADPKDKGTPFTAAHRKKDRLG